MTEISRDLGRFLFLVPWLARHPEGVTVDEVCARLDLDARALHKLVERAAMVGTPGGAPDEFVDLYIEGDRVFVALPQEFRRAPRFSPEEMLALLVVLAPLRAAPLPELAREAEALYARLEGLASERAQGLARGVAGRVQSAGEGAELADTLRALELAVRERRVCDAVYYTAGRDEVRARELRPVALVERKGAWYAIGHDEKTFKVERFADVTPRDETFELPPELDLAPYRRGELFAWERPDAPRQPPASVPKATFRVRGEEVEIHGRAVRHHAWVRASKGNVVWVGPSGARDAFLSETRELLARYDDPPQ